MDVIQLYQDYHVDFLTEGHKHCSVGWVNTPCPFCIGNPGYHLGTPLNGEIYKCRRCGLHFPDTTIAKLLNISKREAQELIKEYGGVSRVRQKDPVKVKKIHHKFPNNIEPLIPKHKRYLERRGFDPDYLEKKYGLMSANLRCLLAKVKASEKPVDYSRRIIAPIYWESQQVSFQGRDVTDKHPMKYLACMKERELIHHKHLLYGIENTWGDTGIAVEGIFDVYRLGDNSFGTFGIEYTSAQVRIMAKKFKRVIVLFDDEKQAITQANKLVADLRFRGVDSLRINIEGDPGGMPQDEADYLVKQLIK